jgi:Methane oxygenase PmoA
MLRGGWNRVTGAALGLAMILALTTAGKDIVLEVASEAGDRVNTPVIFALPDSLAGQSRFTLTEIASKRPVDVQVDRGRVLWIVRNRLAAGQTRRYRLSAGSSKTPPAAIAAEDDGKRVLIKAGSRNVLQYNEKTTFEGRPANFWEPSNGTVEHDAIQSTTSGLVFAGFRATLRHMVNDAAGGPRQALRETWDVRVYNIADQVIFDLESVQEAAGQSPLIIEKNSYGGLAIRCHRNWFDPKNSEYLTSEGKTRKDRNQTRPAWVDLYGWIDGRMSGVAIFDHPGNLQFPQPVRLHPEKPYFCFAPMAAAPFRIEPGKPLVSRYRFYVHMDKPDADKIGTAWRDFADPPQVRIADEN